MTKEEIYSILKIAAGFELDSNNLGISSINKTFKSKYESFPNNNVLQEYMN